MISVVWESAQYTSTVSWNKFTFWTLLVIRRTQTVYQWPWDIIQHQPSITNPFEYGKYGEALWLKQSLKSSAHQLDICVQYSVHCVSCSIIDEEMNFLFTAKWLWYLIDCEERNYIVSFYTTLKIMLEFSIIMYTFVKKNHISVTVD
jgi:hypothetical protein